MFLRAAKDTDLDEVLRHLKDAILKAVPDIDLDKIKFELREATTYESMKMDFMEQFEAKMAEILGSKS
jgi:hypothetical protein